MAKERPPKDTERDSSADVALGEPQDIPASRSTEDRALCGLVMPISETDGCSEAHWAEVRGILTEAIADAGFEGRLVSDADESGVIQGRIIQNLYTNPIVVCDVSGRNPNVMFELGVRLTFDKPTVIVKDDNTSFAFDISAIEHVSYPRSLRFAPIVAFKKQLTDKIKATCKRAQEDESYSTFLRHFNILEVSRLERKEVSKDELVLAKLDELQREISVPRSAVSPGDRSSEVVSEIVRITKHELGLKGQRWSDLTPEQRDSIHQAARKRLFRIMIPTSPRRFGIVDKAVRHAIAGMEAEE